MQAARRLHTRVGRQRAGAFLAEGEKVVLEALRSGAPVESVFLSSDAAARAEIADAAGARGVAATEVESAVMASLSEASTPQGVVAVVRTPPASLDRVPSAASLVLVLADVRDPGNAGTLIRSAVGAGADAVVTGSGAVDPFHPKTVRASAGALFRVPVLAAAYLDDALHALRRRGLVVVGADADATRAASDVDLTRRVALVVGNEAWGIGPRRRDLLDEVVGIPMPGPTESLNAAVAGSILLFEAVRQRRERERCSRASGARE